MAQSKNLVKKASLQNVPIASNSTTIATWKLLSSLLVLDP
jgi:hypothetical protein